MLIFSALFLCKSLTEIRHQNAFIPRSLISMRLQYAFIPRSLVSIRLQYVFVARSLGSIVYLCFVEVVRVLLAWYHQHISPSVANIHYNIIFTLIFSYILFVILVGVCILLKFYIYLFTVSNLNSNKLFCYIVKNGNCTGN